MTAEQLPNPSLSGRVVIVNADDFGRTLRINNGVLRAHVQGIVTSASLMVRWPAAKAAATSARVYPALSVGLHVDLGEWVFRDGQWRTVYEVVPLDDRERVEVEVDRQLERFRKLLASSPTHIDSHQHVHRSEPVRGVLCRVADRLGVPLRGESEKVMHCGAFYGQTGLGEPLVDAITVDGLSAIFCGLQPGVTEIACHPAEGVDDWSPYSLERDLERRTLCDPRIRAVIDREGILLASFKCVARPPHDQVSRTQPAFQEL